MAVMRVKISSEGTENIDFESGIIDSYLDNYDSDHYSLSNITTYDGAVYSLFVDVGEYVEPTTVLPPPYYANKDLEENKPTTVDVIIYYNYEPLTYNQEDFYFAIVNENGDDLTAVTFSRQYNLISSESPRKTMVNCDRTSESTVDAIDCGIMTGFKWLRFRFENINFVSKKFDFSIYNLTDDSLVFTNTETSFVNDSNSVSKIEFDCRAGVGTQYQYYIDSVVATSIDMWQRVI